MNAVYPSCVLAPATPPGNVMSRLLSQVRRHVSQFLSLTGAVVLMAAMSGPAQAQTAPAGYYLACQERSECVIGPYSKDVAYGTGDQLSKRVGMTGTFTCNSDTFGGDPARKKTKYCFISLQESRRQAIATGGSYVNVNPKQTVWYGVDGNFTTKEVQGNVLCDNKTFGDPAKGRYKGCFIFQPW
jgi:hypothetical protein